MIAFRVLLSALLVAAFLRPAGAADERLRDTIDREIKAGWAKEKITAPGQSSDTVFLRRVYLDLVGMIPTY
ncbi:MAG: DUF1549 domain-containing protein, partial [Planctomycetes bacterium]|nr:DUF1549 domain-containing protein [Planctomycetota bacterium]